MITAAGGAMLDQKFFVSRLDDPFPDLYERFWDGVEWIWVNHGRPDGVRMRTAPGAAMLNEKVFVVTDDGNLRERNWRSDLSRWVWEDHGRPGNQRITQAPGAAMLNEKLFVVTETGNLWERQWRSDLGQWAWEDHGRPADARAASAPGAAMMDSKLFLGGDNAHLFERAWTGESWTWVDHGTAFHDRSAHVIGAPGDGPAITVAVMGDGFAEPDMADYHNHVQDKVVAAFGMDQLGSHRNRVRVIRIDVVSPVTGVTERRYDEHGTTDTAADDTLLSEDFKFSRLGFIGTGLWSHCWIETSARTDPRLRSIWRRFAPEATRVIVLVNSTTNGGCNRGDIASFTRAERAQTVAHELGHNLFALGDEYNNATLAFTGVAPQANLSEVPPTWDALKWRDLVADGTPLPTDPGAVPAGWNDNTSVGAFPGGAGNFASGIFHPVRRCRMNQNDPPWCPVCGREIDRIFGGL